MSVYQQSAKSWSYKFMSRGKYYTGVCHGCATKKQALDFEKGIKAKAADLAKMKTVQALAENFREELSGGRNIPLDNAFELALEKPRQRLVGKKFLEQKRGYWRDFAAFVKDFDDEVTNLAQVERRHAEAYARHLESHGRFLKTISYQAGQKTKTYDNNAIPSTKTRIIIQQALKEVFSLLAEDAGILKNPFGFRPPKKESETREAFTEDELDRIMNVADDFTRPLFITGISTAMRLGDCCTLRWDEINLSRGIISRKQSKTGQLVEIPLFPKMAEIVEVRRATLSGETSEWSRYLFPEQAQMYKENPDGIHWRIAKTLESADIETTRHVPGRTRKVTVRGFHSLRHTFAYLAGKHGIPLPVVQSLCGHMSPEMTRLYMSHATITDKKAVAVALPGLLGAPEGDGVNNPDRQRLRSLAETLPLDIVGQILKTYGD